MSKLTFLKPSFYRSIAESILIDIQHRISRYYYFIGRTSPWSEEVNPETPIDSLKYDRDIRNNIIAAKQIKPSDICYVVSRYDWKLNEAGEGQVYDQYDDRYDTTVCGIDLKYSGVGYVGPTPKVYIGSTGNVLWQPNSVFEINTLVKVVTNSVTSYYICKNTGTTGEIQPSHTEGEQYSGTCLLQYVANIDDKNGSGAAAEVVVSNNKITAINIIKSGSGYVDKPSVLIVGECTDPAEAEAVVMKSALSNVQRIEDTKFYVLTDDLKVYKCLDNNNGAKSNIKPVHTTTDAVEYDDGYIWKYMYSISPALKNKFLTKYYMPVTSALQNRFYTDGGITVVQIESPGSDYTAAKLNVIGDGYLKSDPLYITGKSIVEQGSNYGNSPSIEFDKPFKNVRLWTASARAIRGEKHSHQNNIYEVVVSGTMGATGPTHMSGQAVNGTAVLEYVGTTISGTLTATGGEITGITLKKKIRSIEIITGGSGYNHTPTVYFSDNTKGAIGKAVVQNGTVVFIETVEKGQNYITDPAIIIGDKWEARKVVWVNDQVFHGQNLYTVTKAGMMGTEPPTHDVLNREVLNGEVLLKYVGKAAKAYALMQHGAGYSTVPEITIDGFDRWYQFAPATKDQRLYYENNRYIVTSVAGNEGKTGEFPPIHTEGVATNGNVELQWAGTQAYISLDSIKSEAIIYPIIDNEQIVNTHIVDSGVGYTYADIEVKNYEGSVGKYASLVPNLYIGNIEIPQADAELLAVEGEINCIPIVSGGYGYGYLSFGTFINVPPTIRIVGNGVGAAATAVVNNGRVTKITVDNPGHGYTWANIIIESSYGYGASARAIIGPYGGHGYNAVNELFARKVMVFTSISKDFNQGFAVENNYRQIGIIRSPKDYTTKNILSAANISACWVINGDATSDIFVKNSILTNSNGYRFKIIESLIADPVVYATSRDGAIPDYGDTLTDRDGNEYIVTYINQITLEIHANAISNNVPVIGTIIVSTTNKRYDIRAISRPYTSLLVQAIDDVAPAKVDKYITVEEATLVNENGDLFTVREITPPTMDKYSGSLIFINNRMPFSPTSEQTITLKTLVEF